MSDKPNGFMEVTDRLRLVLELSTEGQLAAKLGFSVAAWSQRKKRNSLPTREIDSLIAAEQLNPEFIYGGVGPIHVAIDTKAWKDVLTKKLAAILQISVYENVLISNGYKPAFLKDVAAGKKLPTIELLRDMHDQLACDLNALICNERGVSPDEVGLLSDFRIANKEGKALVLGAANFAAKAATSNA
jgi:transcriptional regulator with XRE-family HTH domain